MFGSNSLDLSFEEAEVTKQTRLYYAHTECSRWKKRALENVYDLFSDLESEEEKGAYYISFGVSKCWKILVKIF